MCVNWIVDPISDGLDDFHGTAVAGVMAGSLGGGDIVGVAHGASLAMFRMGFGFEASASQTEAVLGQMANVDIVNNSWTYGEAFTDNKNELKSAEFFEEITDLAPSIVNFLTWSKSFICIMRSISFCLYVLLPALFLGGFSCLNSVSQYRSTYDFKLTILLTSPME